MAKFLTLLSLLLISLPLIAQDNISVPTTQQSLITKRTATWCPICGNSAWDMYRRILDEHEDNALVIAGHHSSSSKLYSQTARDLIDNFQSTFSQPVFYFNSEFVGGSGNQTETNLKTKVDVTSVQSPLAQSGLQALYDPVKSRIELRSNTQFFSATSGNFYLGFYIIQKTVVEDQASRGANVDHKNVLWSSFTSDAFGTSLVSGDVEKNQLVALTQQIDIPIDMIPENLIIASILWQKDENDKYSLVNTNKTEEFVYTVLTSTKEWKNIADYQINPTLSNGPAQLQFELINTLKKAEIKVFDINGKLVKTLYNGRLDKGNHHIPVDVSRSGMYFIQLRAGSQQISKRFIRH